MTPPLKTLDPGIDSILKDRDYVIDPRTALARLSPGELRWRIESGRWRQPCRGVIVAHSGPLTSGQKLRIAALWGGPGSALAGLTAARLQGLRGFDRDPDTIHLLRPGSRTTRRNRPDLEIVVHYSRYLAEEDIQPLREPPRTRIARSLADAAAWMATDRGAQAILAAGVQQGLTRPTDILHQVTRNNRMPRRRLLKTTLGDIAGGSHALSELDFMTNVVRRFRLPAPDRQVPRRDSRGKRRWLDVMYEKARLVIEIDGAGHMDILEYWDDMGRDRELMLAGNTVLRFPAYMVRYAPQQIATQIRQALA
jgi:hypothetical protein